jgi:hypothetical protein
VSVWIVRFKRFLSHANVQIVSHFESVSIGKGAIRDKVAYCEKEACSEDLLVLGSMGLLSAEEKPTQTAWPLLIRILLQEVTLVFANMEFD